MLMKWNHVEFNFKKLKNFDTQKFDIDKVLQRPFNLKLSNPVHCPELYDWTGLYAEKVKNKTSAR